MFVNSEQFLNVLNTKCKNRAAQKCSQTQRNVKNVISGRRRRKKWVFSAFSLRNPSCIGIYTVLEILGNFRQKIGIYTGIYTDARL